MSAKVSGDVLGKSKKLLSTHPDFDCGTFTHGEWQLVHYTYYVSKINMNDLTYKDARNVVLILQKNSKNK